MVITNPFCEPAKEKESITYYVQVLKDCSKYRKSFVTGAIGKSDMNYYENPRISWEQAVDVEIGSDKLSMGKSSIRILGKTMGDAQELLISEKESLLNALNDTFNKTIECEGGRKVCLAPYGMVFNDTGVKLEGFMVKNSWSFIVPGDFLRFASGKGYAGIANILIKHPDNYQASPALIMKNFALAYAEENQIPIAKVRLSPTGIFYIDYFKNINAAAETVELSRYLWSVKKSINERWNPLLAKDAFFQSHTYYEKALTPKWFGY